MTCLDRETLGDAYQVAAELAVFESQRAAELLAEFRRRWKAWAYHWNRAEGEDRVGEAWIALIEVHDGLMDRGQP
jgi:phage-related baseplate assembly protein